MEIIMKKFFVQNWYAFVAIVLFSLFAMSGTNVEATKEKAYNEMAMSLNSIAHDPGLEYVLAGNPRWKKTADISALQKQIYDLRRDFHFWAQDTSDKEFNELIAKLRQQGLDIDAEIIPLPFSRRTYSVILKTTYGDFEVYEDRDY
jgi:hypothetical protein